MIDVINAEREEHILTIEDPIEFLHTHKRCIVNQREIGADADGLRPRPEGRAARGPRRDPRRRDARPGDDLDRADRGRDRPPRLRHPAHPVDRADGRPDHRRLPAPAAGPGPDAALDRACRGSSPSSCCRPPTASGRVVACEVLVPTPAIRNLIREGKTHQIYSAMQTSGSIGMQTMDAHLAQLVRIGQDHPRSWPSSAPRCPRSSSACSAAVAHRRRPIGAAARRRDDAGRSRDDEHLRLPGGRRRRRALAAARSRPSPRRRSPSSCASAA